jgi:hypothetical protein
MAYPASELARRRLNQRRSPFTAFGKLTGVSARFAILGLSSQLDLICGAFSRGRG